MKYALLTKRKSVVICEENEVESLSKKGYKLRREADSLQVLEIAKRDIETTLSSKKRRRYVVFLVFMSIVFYFYQLYVGDERAVQVFGGKGEASTRDLCAARSELSSIARKGFDAKVDGDLGIECVQLGINQ